ncbi:MAG TPA: hypothetical protein DIT09_13340 [Glutamicibacter sp.]|nr:hypothetical protein [Glutamicibacter sp.]
MSISSSYQDGLGPLWHAKNALRVTQKACASVEKAYGLETAPRLRKQMKQLELVERENVWLKTQLAAVQRAQKEREAQNVAARAARLAKWRAFSFPTLPTTRNPASHLGKLRRHMYRCKLYVQRTVAMKDSGKCSLS